MKFWPLSRLAARAMWWLRNASGVRPTQAAMLLLSCYYRIGVVSDEQSSRAGQSVIGPVAVGSLLALCKFSEAAVSEAQALGEASGASAPDESRPADPTSLSGFARSIRGPGLDALGIRQTPGAGELTATTPAQNRASRMRRGPTCSWRGSFS